jgi:hypothetical protein
MIMGRIYNTIDVHGRKSWTLFDSGARNTYVVREVADVLATEPVAEPLHSALGGSVREITETALLNGVLEGLPITTQAMVVDKLGFDDNGQPIEILLGALAMQQWGIRLIPEHEKIDLTHYPHEFVEF